MADYQTHSKNRPQGDGDLSQGLQSPVSRPSDILRRGLYSAAQKKYPSWRKFLYSLERRPIGPLDRPAISIFSIGLIVVIVCLGYFISGLWGGALTNPAYASLSGQGRARVLSNLALVDHTAIIAAIVTLLAYVFLLYHEEIAGYLLFGVTLLLWLAVPAETASQFGSRLLQPTDATQAILADIRGLAWIIAIPSLALVGLDLFQRIIFGIDAAASKGLLRRRATGRSRDRRKRAYLFLGPCWKQPGGAKSNLCLWDDAALHPVSDLRTFRRVGSGLDHTATGSAAHQYLVRPPTLANKKAQCRQCRYFLEHERQKFNVLSWTAVLSITGALVFGYEAALGWIRTWLASMQMFTNQMSFAAATHAGTMGGFQTIEPLPDSVAWTILLAVTICGLSKILQLIEYCCLQLKI